jgi:protein TonB
VDSLTMTTMNQTSRKSLPPAKSIVGGASADPMARVLTVGTQFPAVVTTIAAVLLHVGIAAGATAATLFGEMVAWNVGIRSVVDARLSAYEVDLVKEPPPEPEAKAAPEPVEEKPAPKDVPPQPQDAPPKPAEAGNILSAAPTPNDGPVDLTSAFMTGSGSTYAGGSTSSDGTSKTAVYNPAAAATGVLGGTGKGPVVPTAPKEDKSRAPGRLGSDEWNDCPFPGEADAEQIDQAFVLLQVSVRPDGTPESVNVLQDPGHGFGREARKCAMRKRYVNGLDAEGNAIRGNTKPFRVRFER